MTEDRVMAWFVFHRLAQSGRPLEPDVLHDAIAEYRQYGMAAADSLMRKAFHEYERKFPLTREPSPSR